MKKGYIKIHREILDHPVFDDPVCFKLWITLICMANHKDRRMSIGAKFITVKFGQLLTSRKSLSDKTGIQESKIERLLKLFKTEQQIEQESHSKYRVITVNKYEEYQIPEHQNEQQVNSKRTASEQQVNTNNTLDTLNTLEDQGANQWYERWKSAVKALPRNKRRRYSNNLAKVKKNYTKLKPSFTDDDIIRASLNYFRELKSMKDSTKNMDAETFLNHGVIERLLQEEQTEEKDFLSREKEKLNGSETENRTHSRTGSLSGQLQVLDGQARRSIAS